MEAIGPGNEAGLPKRCSAHGLRKAACRRLAEAWMQRAQATTSPHTGRRTCGPPAVKKKQLTCRSVRLVICGASSFVARFPYKTRAMPQFPGKHRSSMTLTGS